VTRVSISTSLAVTIVLSILVASAPPVGAVDAEEFAQASEELVANNSRHGPHSGGLKT